MGVPGRPVGAPVAIGRRNRSPPVPGRPPSAMAMALGRAQEMAAWEHSGHAVKVARGLRTSKI